SQTAYTVDGKTIKAVNKLGCFIGFIILTSVLSSIVVPIILAFSGNRSHAPTGKTGSPGWKLSYTQQTFYANGSKGAVIWQLDEENYNWEKTRNVLSILDAETKKVLHSEIFVKEHKTGTDAASTWDIFNGGRVIGDTIFFTPKGSGLVARNIYTGKIIIGNDGFEKLLGDQIAEARAYINFSTNDKDYLEIKSAQGDEYYYYSSKNAFVRRDEIRNNSKKTAKYYFILVGNNDKKHVLRINQDIAVHDRAGFFHPGNFREFNQQKKYYAKYHYVNSLDSVPAQHVFFDAGFITWDDTSFVVQFKESVLETAPRVIARYGLSGKQLWRIVPVQEKPFTQLKKKEESPRFDILLNNKTVMVTLGGAQKSAMAIDPGNGKILWTYISEN
ncbi:MAG TPA: hypothetical protein VD905_07395, partial [Flavobacteriales bacterium]|nr:hypothetical protein [Flavobacteriales bacterium]